MVDTHCDVLHAMVTQDRHMADDSTVGHVDRGRLIRAGMRLQFFSCWLEPEYKPDRALRRQLEIVDRFWREVASDTAHFRAVLSREDVAALDEDPRIGALASLEGAEGVVNVEVLRMLHRLGVRCIALTWNERNHLADGVGVEEGGGLTEEGLAVVAEMRRLGVLLDVSHIHPRGFWHIMEATEGPFIASHSNAKAVHDHRRNMDDAQIRALAARGGVMGLNFYAGFVHAEADIDRVLDHADHVLSLVGDAHLGVGADYDGMDVVPKGLEDVTKMPDFAEAMLRRGYSDETVRRIMGENFRRVLLETLPPAEEA